MREALSRLPGVSVADIAEDRYRPIYRGLPLRVMNRLLRPWQERELFDAVRRALRGKTFDALVVYKGNLVGPALVEEAKRRGILTVNIFPDYSPHAYGSALKDAMGRYDLVISTKPFHPALWKSVYGYDNKCVLVPHGYDSAVHLWDDPAPMDAVDVAICATWRPEYHRWMMELGRLIGNENISMAVAGFGWESRMRDLPAHWRCAGLREGRAYGDFLRSARVVIAPVNREVIIRGVRQPGDEDTIRTYELAAMRCFFLHQRTDYAKTVYDERREVPLWSDAQELAALIRRYLPDEPLRRSMADAAHARAVPAYSFEHRARDVAREIEAHLPRREA